MCKSLRYFVNHEACEGVILQRNIHYSRYLKMNPLDLHDILLWVVIISLVVLATVTGMYINRMFMHRAHRRALQELRRRTLGTPSSSQEEMEPHTVSLEH